jgi:transcription elongation GreA/GreB family factor
MLGHRMQLEERLLSARVITKREVSEGSVSVGSTVRLRDIAANKTVEYHIVGSAERTRPRTELSNESRSARRSWALKKGDTVEVAAPRGSLSSRSSRSRPPEPASPRRVPTDASL